MKGNLKTRTNPNGVTLTINYDALVRPVTKSYSDGTAPAIFAYDGQGDFRGSLASVSRTVDGVLYQTSFAHDELGRVSSSTQSTGGKSYPFFYQYSLSDRLAQLKYPSGRIVEYTPNAQGRVLAVKDVGAGTNYATLGYTDAGLVGSVSMRNGITESYAYNDRLQRTRIQAGSLLTLGLYPCGSGLTQCASGNDGNVRSESITIPGASWTQTFGYDGVNRLTSAIETGQGTGLRLMTM